MKTIALTTVAEALNVCQRPTLSSEQIAPLISRIFETVIERGDTALREYTRQFDRVAITDLEVSRDEIHQSAERVSPALQTALQTAAQHIHTFHLAQRTKAVEIETAPGVRCWQEARPIEKIGIYIPGGSAPLFSTVLMLAIPARIAGCKEIVLCSPPGKEGTIDPAILYAAQLTGVTRLFRVGGAQAIAAMTAGTESIPQVHKLFGPGNQYVTCAKMYAQQMGTAIDMPAGPSELLVMADESCIPEFVAADLLSQAEHGSDSHVICTVTDDRLVPLIKEAIDQQVAVLPRREIAIKALKHAVFVVCSNTDDLLDFVNQYGPEHLIIAMKNARKWSRRIEHAGSVFIGNYTPESAGDYASGTNHTLPTNGFAKSYSGVNLDAFVKKITFQAISKDGLQQLGSIVETMAEAEQLHAHKAAVTLRLNRLKDEHQ